MSAKFTGPPQPTEVIWPFEPSRFDQERRRGFWRLLVSTDLSAPRPLVRSRIFANCFGVRRRDHRLDAHGFGELRAIGVGFNGDDPRPADQRVDRPARGPPARARRSAPCSSELTCISCIALNVGPSPQQAIEASS